MARTKTMEMKVSGKSPASSLVPGKGKSAGRGVELPGAGAKFRPGAVALKEIRKYQKSSDLLIRKLPFQRLLRSLTSSSDELRFQAAALVIFQEALANFLTSLLEDSYRCAVHAKRVTLLSRDIILIYKIKYSRYLTTSMV